MFVALMSVCQVIFSCLLLCFITFVRFVEHGYIEFFRLNVVNEGKC